MGYCFFSRGCFFATKYDFLTWAGQRIQYVGAWNIPVGASASLSASEAFPCELERESVGKPRGDSDKNATFVSRLTTAATISSCRYVFACMQGGLALVGSPFQTNRPYNRTTPILVWNLVRALCSGIVSKGFLEMSWILIE